MNFELICYTWVGALLLLGAYRFVYIWNGIIRMTINERKS